ncbi:wax ester/triacylglycerol synthase family O-acyltransferase [Sinimarinibacterium sp. NLF-5-8]|uniref:WS/DGAT/MGAT family O-acyltransferase n=1 Tax=Sinimarinibacterium sp. NLF-5-8 TaxID=2698684 RepID=UPI00137BEFA0|nr:wax ester/triacylglycerol synthase family O-acyltransferase [Sinimarinibacterium sp. NLF-5-8]QHS11292.1 wax ester/triacylglycerol synthase family O-acyltransferase [Sinimarinibacterium sp. NLF-5-8]
MSKLSAIDAAFLRMESTRTPMHVGALMTFKLPDDAPADFCQRLVAKMREQPFMPEPFNCCLAQTRTGKPKPQWVESKVDMEYHLRHSALPHPGGEKELGVLVARMHSHPLDLTRPLWEAHVIEGLENNRFALYFKAHHCAIDGMGAMKMVQKWLSTDPASQDTPGPWVLAEKPPKSEPNARSLRTRLGKVARAAGEQLVGLRELAKGLNEMMRGEDSSARLALEVPRSLFNQRISQQRRLGTQILDLSRLRAVCKASNTSVNDVLLAVIGGGVRRYLLEQNAMPERSIIASVPIGLSRGDAQTGTAAAGFITPIGTDIDDPVARLHWIHRITTRAKRELNELHPTAQSQFALMGIAPILVGQVLGILPKLPPLFNFVVSNVVLSKDPLYLMGAELEAMYPVSFLFDGYGLNVTVVGYRDRVAVGFLGCREAIPSLQRLAVYTGEALGEMEQAMAAAQARAPKKTTSRKKTKTEESC